jgi:hypothetical protein
MKEQIKAIVVEEIQRWTPDIVSTQAEEEWDTTIAVAEYEDVIAHSVAERVGALLGEKPALTVV